VIGPTETFSIRRHFIDHDWKGEEGKVPVGYPVADKEVLLFDENGREAGPGEVGEIAVRSKYLAVGYWRQPELTRAAFVPDPDGGEARMYFTGDLGVMRPDGCLVHLGRKDFQVKIRGHRVEVGEIEAALARLDAVKAAIVHPQPDRNGEQRLVAYVVPAPGKTALIDELRRELALTLPDFMMPSHFVILEDLPLLPNGKVNRRALPPPGAERPELPELYVAPRNATEATLATIWSEALEIDTIGIHDRFLDLGGDSLRASRILGRTIDCLGIELSVTDVLQTETIAQMAEMIELLKTSDSKSDL
jgi:acyl carrier protein